MSLKKKLGLGVASAALGLSLIGGGTYAYFSDTAVQTNTFASGTVVLDVDPTTIVNLEDLKPGDWIPRTFNLINNGSLDMKYVDLKTSYTVKKNGVAVGSTLADKYADSIIVDFMNNTSGDADHEVIASISLKDLRDLTPDELATKIDIERIMTYPGFWLPIFGWIIPPQYEDQITEVSGIESGDEASFDVQFRFDETGDRQNDLQGLELELNWTFEGYQTDGEQR
ncbi:TasA family protein [Lederbergia graminis]|uniref:TasA family protein n=1 Tax=Lederbergia graminis TaxID=735518 RepID=A0ABW0LFZ5_9BACI